MWIGNRVNIAHQQSLHHRARRRLVQRLRRKLRNRARIAIQHFAKQLFLVAECCVQAGTFNPHRPGQIRKGSSFIPFLPENLQRRIQGFSGVKTPRSPDLSATRGCSAARFSCAYGLHLQQHTPILYQAVKNMNPSPSPPHLVEHGIIAPHRRSPQWPRNLQGK